MHGGINRADIRHIEPEASGPEARGGGHGDVFDGSHVLAFLMAQGVPLASHFECAPREGNSLQKGVNACSGGPSLPVESPAADASLRTSLHPRSGRPTLQYQIHGQFASPRRGPSAYRVRLAGFDRTRGVAEPGGLSGLRSVN